MGGHERTTKAKRGAGLERMEHPLAKGEESPSSPGSVLWQSQQMLGRIIDGSPVPTFVISKDHTVIFWNQALATLSGLPAEKMIGTREQWRAFYDTERPCMADLMLEGADEAIPHWYAGKYTASRLLEGSYEVTDFFPAMMGGGRWLRFTAALLRDASGEVAGAIETLEDVTDQKRAEDALRIRSSLNEQLLSISDFGQKLKTIADLIVDYFGADFARIWITANGDLCEQGCIHATVTEGLHICRDRSRCLHLMVSSGRYTHLDGGHQRVPMGCYKIGRVASGDDLKFLTNDATRDPRIHDHDWARSLGLVSFVGHRLHSSDGKPLCVLALFSRKTISPEDETLLQDIANIASHTIQVGVAEEAVRKSEEKYRGLIETTDTGYVILDVQGRVLDANPKYVSLTGYASLEEIQNRNVLEWTAEHVKQKNNEAVKQCLAQGYIRNLEIEYVHTDGTSIPIEVNATVVKTYTGATILSLCHDITERRKAEAEKRKSEWHTQILNEIARIFLSVPDAEMYAEVLAILLKATDSPYGIFGFIEENGDLVLPSFTKDIWKKCQVSGKSVVFPPETWGDSLWGRALRERKAFYANRLFQTPPGHVPINAFLTVPIVFGDQAIGLLSIANREGGYTEEEKTFLEDIALYVSPILHARLQRDRQERARKTAEEQLRQSQKMESVGRLAGGVAHDFNNLLTAILGYTELALSKTQEQDPELCEWLAEVQRSAERARDLTWQLLAFGRKQALNMRTLDLNELILGLTKLLTRLIGEDIHVVTVLDPELSPLKGDQSQLEQVLLNLAINARDAMPQGGRLTIETTDILLDETYAATHADVHPGTYVMIAVSDTGCGMDAVTLEQIFEPFFTTKAVGKGTGLGLATVYGIVKQHNGHVSVYSEKGHGTTFKVYLPRILSTDESDRTKRPSVATTRGDETILLVEDDAAVRQLACKLLSSLGYEVIEAQDGQDAVRIAAGHKTIHLLLTDVVMPGMGGQQVFENIAVSHPGINVLYMSGYPANVIAHQGVLNEGVRLLQKPFTLQSLAAKVRETLAD